MTWPGIVLLVVALVVAPGFAIWHNLRDGRGGNDIKPTRNRGISGERGA